MTHIDMLTHIQNSSIGHIFIMAESADFNNSAQYVNFNVTNLDRDAFIFHKYNLNLSYDGIRLKWNNSFKELQEFFQNTVGLNG